MEVAERPDGLLVINDAYNANPESMRSALEALAAVSRPRRAAGGRSFAVLGPMAELGPDGPAEHDALGRLAVRLGISRVVAVGDAARPVSTQPLWKARATAGRAGCPTSRRRSRCCVPNCGPPTWC